MKEKKTPDIVVGRLGAIRPAGEAKGKRRATSPGSPGSYGMDRLGITAEEQETEPSAAEAVAKVGPVSRGAPPPAEGNSPSAPAAAGASPANQPPPVRPPVTATATGHLGGSPRARPRPAPVRPVRPAAKPAPRDTSWQDPAPWDTQGPEPAAFGGSDSAWRLDRLWARSRSVVLVSAPLVAVIVFWGLLRSGPSEVPSEATAGPTAGTSAPIQSPAVALAPVAPAPSPTPSPFEPRPRSPIRPPTELTQPQQEYTPLRPPKAVRTPPEEVALPSPARLPAAEPRKPEPSPTPAAVATSQPTTDKAPAPKKYRACPPDISLSGTFAGPRGAMAIIGGRAVSVGDKVKGATVVEITDSSVEMEMDGQYFRVPYAPPPSADDEYEPEGEIRKAPSQPAEPRRRGPRTSEPVPTE